MRFLILSEANIVLNWNHITYIQFNPELERATIWLTNDEYFEVQPQDYDNLVLALANDRLDCYQFKGVKEQ